MNAVLKGVGSIHFGALHFDSPDGICDTFARSQPGYPKYQIGSMKLKPQIHDHERERIGSYSSKVTSPQPYLHLTF